MFPLFHGFFLHALDDKNRLSLPRKFLAVLEAVGKTKSFWAVPGFDKCLYLYLADDYEKFASRVRERAQIGNADDRSFLRWFFGLSRELPVDGTGRILLPRDLKELAGIEGEVNLLGVGDRIEMWSAANWAEEQSRGQEKYMAAAAGILHA